MPVDVHAHYVPPGLLDAVRGRGLALGVEVLGNPPACEQCLRFAYGLKVRPFFARLVESPAERLANMDRQGMTRQVLSIWTDIFGYALAAEQGRAWHRLLNETLGAWCARHPERFSWLASGALPDAAAAARELERSVHEGAVGGVVAANVEGTNLGELPLDEYWAAAVELDVPVFIHPAQPDPTPRVRRFGLNAMAQYTFDTALAVGSLLFSGVLDRFPALRLILSHGGGNFPYQVGRFDVLHARTGAAAGSVAREPPSAYLRRMYYDTILHHPGALRFLSGLVGAERLVIGTDDSFPPADHDPLASLRAAGFDRAQIELIGEENPRRLFRYLK